MDPLLVGVAVRVGLVVRVRVGLVVRVGVLLVTALAWRVLALARREAARPGGP